LNPRCKGKWRNNIYYPTSGIRIDMITRAIKVESHY